MVDVELARALIETQPLEAACMLEQPEYPSIGVVRFVGDEARGLEFRPQGVGPLEVVHLTGGEFEVKPTRFGLSTCENRYP